MISKIYLKSFLFLLFFSGLLTTIIAQRGADYQTITEDGAWCWFSDPRAVYYKREQARTYRGFITSTGNIIVNAQLAGSEILKLAE